MKEEVKNQIYVLFRDYCLDKKLIDDVFIKKIIDIYKSNYQTEDLIQGLIYITDDLFENEDFKRYTQGLSGIFGRTAYDNYTNKIVVYIDNVRRDDDGLVRNFGLEEQNQVIFKNALLLQTLMHEFNHVLQKSKDGISDPEEKALLEATDTEKVENTYTYRISITERLAEAHSIDDLFEMLELLANQIEVDPCIFTHFERSKKTFLKETYELSGEMLPPTSEYVKEMELDKEEFEKVASSVYDTNKRILFGLEVSEEEFNEYFSTAKKL